MSDAHAHADETPHAPHDHAAEIAHIKEHAFHNIFWFAGFFTLILITVANYEFSSSNNYWSILGLAASRSLLIALFLNWLFRRFSFVLRTFIFTIIFFAGMVLLSMWDSQLHGIGNPIRDSANEPPPAHVP